MVKRRYRAKPRRRRRYFARIRRSKPKIPLEIAVTGMAIPFVKAAPWRSESIWDAINQGQFDKVGKDLVLGFTPIDPYSGNVDIMSYINPFNFDRGMYMKMLLYAGLASKVRKSFVKIPFQRVPFIGKYIS